MRGLLRERWEAALSAAYDDFCSRVDAAEARGAEFDETSALDPYAAESPGEFFAVMSETFFETPEVLRAEYPQLYDQFCRFYRQDPATR